MRYSHVFCSAVGLASLAIALYQLTLILIPRAWVADRIPSPSPRANFPWRIQIPALNLDLKIVTASLAGARWPQTSEGVTHLAQSAIPGKLGNSVLYGHNWRSILGLLPRIKPGDEISILLSDNSVLRFVVAYTQIVAANQTHILNDSGDIRLTIYTCTGFLDSKRFVVVAIPLIPT